MVSGETDNRTDRRKIGDSGEQLAVRFLVKRGFRILDRNYLRSWGELDIVAFNNKIHFVEVKTVTCQRFSRETDNYRPEDNVHHAKLSRLGRIIQTYLFDNKHVSRETDWQLDLITVYLDTKGECLEIKYLEDIIL